MKNLNPYLHFNGQCREALDFYKTCFKGEISGLQTYADAKVAGPEEYKNKVLHAEFRAGDILFMASDGRPGYEAKAGNNISMSVNLSDEKEQTEIFEALADGGTISMPLETTFWGARFGMVTDRYGITWMLNCTRP